MDSSAEFNPYLPPSTPLDASRRRARAGAAPRGERLGAWFVDWMAVLLASLVATPLTMLARGPVSTPLLTLAPFLALAAADLWLLARRGQTIGKWNQGIAIVRADGSRAGLVRLVLLRFAVPHAMFVAPAVVAWPWIGLGLFLVDSLAIFGRESRCLHDRMAGTKVIAI